MLESISLIRACETTEPHYNADGANVFVDGTEVDVFTQYDITTVSEAVTAAQSHLDDAATGLDEVLS